jgi:hypothetical protein
VEPQKIFSKCVEAQFAVLFFAILSSQHFICVFDSSHRLSDRRQMTRDEST